MAIGNSNAHFGLFDVVKQPMATLRHHNQSAVEMIGMLALLSPAGFKGICVIFKPGPDAYIFACNRFMLTKALELVQ